MDFLQTLRAHTGGLIRIKSELFWYGGRGWDGIPDRICLVLDATALAGVTRGARAAHCRVTGRDSDLDVAVLLLIDCRPQWVWVTREDVELIT